MVTLPVLFDTNILIDYLRGIPQARAECDRHTDRAISIVTWMEVMAGSTASNEADARSFLQNFYTLPLDADVAERAFLLRRTNRIKLPDAIIQATAEESGRILITRNTRDFPAGTPGVLVPYSL
ncbi:MAG TPA: type II toxin-antitoxin system VapC family toxin [Terracidiphilus sp.]|jgi:predicted nucleic acid-binding protein